MAERETIEAALERVYSGELSPARATDLLLGTAAKVSPHESLASLCGRMGRPPADIVHSLCQQLHVIAARYESETSAAIPIIDLSDWSISRQGELVLDGWQFDRSQPVLAPGHAPSQTSIDRIEDFRRIMNPVEAEWTAGETIAPGEMPVFDPAAARPATESDRRCPKGKRSTTRRVGFVAAGVAGVTVAGFLLSQAFPGDDQGVASRQATPIGRPISGGSATSPATSAGVESQATGSRAPDPAELPPLETFESIGNPESAMIQRPELATTLSLDDWVPLTDLAPSNADRANPESDAPGPGERAVGAPESTTQSAHALLTDDSAAPDGSPQQTRASTIMAVGLPPMNQPDGRAELSGRAVEGLKLEFPIEIPLVLSGDGPDWQIRDTRKSITLATVTSASDGTWLKWERDARDASSASDLTHGRITLAEGSKVFLRPVVEADPWPMRLQSGDVMPTWDLGGPIPPRVSRIAIHLDLPEQVDQAWIEPIDPAALRRGRALAVLTPRDGETVALGMRLDIRCGRKLSCRMRFAARLDPTSPWQWVSVPYLEQLADQLAGRAEMLGNEATRLEQVFDRATSAGRRILRLRQTRLGGYAEAIRIASTRLAQLQALIAALEAEGFLRIRIWVVWPDQEQELLRMSHLRVNRCNRPGPFLPHPHARKARCLTAHGSPWMYSTRSVSRCGSQIVVFKRS